MSVEYEFTAEDFSEFNLHHFAHSRTFRRQFYRGLIVPPSIWLVVCLAIWHLASRQNQAPGETFLALLPLFAGVPLYLAFFPWLRRRGIRRTLAGLMREGKSGNLVGWCRVTVGPEGVTEERADSRSTSSWNAVEQVIDAGDHCYIYVSALLAVVVPRRAFSDQAAFEAFVNAATRYHKKRLENK